MGGLPTTLNTALSDYYEVRLTRLAPATRKAHICQLERWRTWTTHETQPNVYLEDLDDRLMNRYFNRLLPPGHAPITYNSYRQYTNLFWKFCLGEGWVRTNPMRHVDPVRVPTKVRLLLSADELLRMLHTAHERDRIALSLGMNTALRAGDLMRLTVGQVNLGTNFLTAEIAKTKGADDLPIVSELHDDLMRWFQFYGPACGIPWQDIPNTWTLIPPMQSVAFNAHDNTLGRRVIYETGKTIRHPETIVQRALAGLGHPTKGEGFHTLRRSALRVLFDLSCTDGVGDPIRIPQSLAGHKNRATTEVYLGITHEKRMRDDMLRGQSFLGRAVKEQQARNQEGGGEGGVRAVV